MRVVQYARSVTQTGDGSDLDDPSPFVSSRHVGDRASSSTLTRRPGRHPFWDQEYWTCSEETLTVLWLTKKLVEPSAF